MIDARAIGRLQAMDVPVWRLRGRKAPAPEPAEPEAASRRIRLEAGSGRWLLVVEDTERDRHAALLEDIRAALGTSDCRFGTWSDSPDAGIAFADCRGHGIGHVLVFEDGVAPRDGLVHAGPLDRLGASPQARRALWQRLRSLLEA
ncbi:MAG: hypothetical protein R6V61_02780 [Wenzhouxiangellaceae bacterium]